MHGPCCQEDASHSFEAETGQARRLRSVSTSIFDRPPVMSFKKKPSISTSSPVRSSGQFALFLSPGLSLSQSADRTAHSSNSSLLSSDRRKLCATIAESYGLPADVAKTLLPEGTLSAKYTTHLDIPGVR